MIKDRLTELKAKSSDSNDFVRSNESKGIFMEDFFNQVNKVIINIEICQTSVSEIENLIGQISKSPIIDQSLRKKLDELMEEVKNALRNIKREIKQIQEKQQKNEKNSVKRIEFRIVKAQYDFLSQSLFSIILNYNKIQLEYKDMHKKRIVRQLEICGKETNQEELENLLDSGHDNVFSYELINETKIARQVMQDVKERHEDFLAIEKKINEVHQMFIDLEFLVESQGEVINRIEQSTSETVENTDKANNFIEKTIVARKNRKKCIRITVIIFFCLFGIIFLIFLIYIFSYFVFFNVSKKFLPF